MLATPGVHAPAARVPSRHDFCLLYKPCLCMVQVTMRSDSPQSLARRVVSESLATALLVAIVIGSGIMGERLSAGNTAVALLANTLATGAGLVMLILTFGPISGAHMNPVVTVADASQGNTRWRDVPYYVVGQILGGRRRRRLRAPHVRPRAVLRVAPRSSRRRAALQRIRGHVRPAVRHLGHEPIAAGGHAVCRHGLHHLGLLVHGIHILCQPGGHVGARRE